MVYLRRKTHSEKREEGETEGKDRKRREGDGNRGEDTEGRLMVRRDTEERQRRTTGVKTW